MRVLTVLGAAVLAASSVSAEVIMVPVQERSIGTALRVAARGDTVLVAPGLYQESVRLPSGVRLESTHGEGVTLVQGSPEKPVIVVPVGGRGTQIVGFTISGGVSGVAAVGRGLEIENCIVSGNTETGVMIESQAAAWLRNCTVARNPVGVSAGRGSRVSISGSRIQENDDGVLCSGAVLTLHRSVVASNKNGIQVSGTKNTVSLGGSALLGNDFFDNESLSLQNLSEDSISASFNYWGAATCDSIRGSIEGPAEWLPAAVDRRHKRFLEECP